MALVDRINRVIDNAFVVSHVIDRYAELQKQEKALIRHIEGMKVPHSKADWTKYEEIVNKLYTAQARIDKYLDSKADFKVGNESLFDRVQKDANRSSVVVKYINSEMQALHKSDEFGYKKLSNASQKEVWRVTSEFSRSGSALSKEHPTNKQLVESLKVQMEKTVNYNQKVLEKKCSGWGQELKNIQKAIGELEELSKKVKDNPNGKNYENYSNKMKQIEVSLGALNTKIVSEQYHLRPQTNMVNDMQTLYALVSNTHNTQSQLQTNRETVDFKVSATVSALCFQANDIEPNTKNADKQLQQACKNLANFAKGSDGIILQVRHGLNENTRKVFDEQLAKVIEQDKKSFVNQFKNAFKELRGEHQARHRHHRKPTGLNT